jgi:hypothetical protein
MVEPGWKDTALVATAQDFARFDVAQARLVIAAANRHVDDDMGVAGASLAEDVFQIRSDRENQIGEVWLATGHDPAALTAVDPDKRHRAGS